MALAALLALSACGEPAAGMACKADADCSEGLTCNTQVAGGYCTKVCASDADCISSSRCDSISGGSGKACARECETKDDCAAGQECNSAEGGAKVCKIKV